MRSLISSTPTPASATADARPARKLLASTALACVMLSGCAPADFEPCDADETSVSMDARQRVILSVDRTGPDGVNGASSAPPSPTPSPPRRPRRASAVAFPGYRRRRRSRPTSRATPHAQEQAAYIGARNATIQLLRDGLYRACKAYMNRALGDSATASSCPTTAGS